MTASAKQDLPHFLAIKRIMKLPVVLSGVNKVTYIYVKVKTSNHLLERSFENAEKTMLSVVDVSVPFIIKFEDPINRIDDLMCKSLDMVEENIPIVTYTPEEIYFSTKTFVQAKVEPVLKRADSVKQLTMLDDALSVADKYVDKYLPGEDPGEDVVDKSGTEPSSQAVKTIRHVNHFSRKLQRRLTRRTIAEAKLLKKQGYDTVQCFVYFADLLARDPKAFADKMKAIWKHLSEDEPENQKPPENIEQLIEMLTREGARRFVHVTNYVTKHLSMGPVYIGRTFSYTVHEVTVLLDNFVKRAHLEKAKGAVVEFVVMQWTQYAKLSDQMKQTILHYLSALFSIENESKKNESADKGKKITAPNNKPQQKKTQKNSTAAATTTMAITSS